MAKKYYKKIYYKKGKWSPNIQNITMATLQAQPNNFYISQELAKNPVQDTATISQQYTIKNVELNFEILSDNQQDITSLCLYIMYVPQGMTINAYYAQQHPEYIMAMRFIGKPVYLDTAPGKNTVRVKSRLSRRLQTGDSLVLFITGNNKGNSTVYINLTGVFRWWSKAN